MPLAIPNLLLPLIISLGNVMSAVSSSPPGLSGDNFITFRFSFPFFSYVSFVHLMIPFFTSLTTTPPANLVWDTMIRPAPPFVRVSISFSLCVCRINDTPTTLETRKIRKQSNSNPSKMAYGRNSLPLHVLREKVRKKRTLNQSRQIAHRRDPLSVHIL
uniref:Putative secreted peptide n=1 Tax=Anopheles braziliensis TaxID=58242 RepID=A0A2M3ZML0_9DIPT